jgi:hypothetical protein
MNGIGRIYHQASKPVEQRHTYGETFVAAFCPKKIQRSIYRNAVQPCAKRRRPIKRRQSFVGLQEYFLRYILAVFGVAHETHYQAKHPSVMFLHEFPEGRLIAFT